MKCLFALILYLEPQKSITGLFCSLTPLYKLLSETLTVYEHLHNKEVPVTQKWLRRNIIVSYLQYPTISALGMAVIQLFLWE